MSIQNLTTYYGESSIGHPNFSLGKVKTTISVMLRFYIVYILFVRIVLPLMQSICQTGMSYYITERYRHVNGKSFQVNFIGEVNYVMLYEQILSTMVPYC